MRRIPPALCRNDPRRAGTICTLPERSAPRGNDPRRAGTIHAARERSARRGKHCHNDEPLANLIDRVAAVLGSGPHHDYEISFTRYFYKPQPLRTLEEIRADIEALEQATEGLLQSILL